jgi:glycosidase
MSQKGCILIYVLVLPAWIQAQTLSLNRPPEDEILYFILPDRFQDGDPSNNYGGDSLEGTTRTDVLRHGYLPTHKGYYHGGDLYGVTLSLPYLQDLGVTALWLAPVFKNKPVQTDSSSLYGHSAGYHGYWILDFLQVDPHLGTNDELRELIEQAHQRGMKVTLDIVTNHTADVIRLQPRPDGDGQAYAYVSKADDPYRDSRGRSFDDAACAYNGAGDSTFPALNEDSFPYRPVVPAQERDAKHPAWLNDARHYHNRGHSTFSGESSLYGDFFGLDDLFTEQPAVVRGMIEIYGSWIRDYRIDGFRIDTARHVNVEFWQAFAPAMQRVAQAAGLNHFYAFGEVADEQGRPEVLSCFTTAAKLQGILDFGFRDRARDFASRSGPTEALERLFALDDYYRPAKVTALPTFLGNHDQGRFGHHLLADNPQAHDGELLARTILAHALMFFARGTPVIYYGDEQGFTGDGGDKDAREDMFPSRVDVYNDNRLIGTKRSTAVSNFDITHPLYRALRRMSRVYRQHAGLRRGAQIPRAASSEPGLYAFSRIDPNDRIEYVVAFNNSPANGGIHARIPTYQADRNFALIYSQPSGEMTTVRTDTRARIACQLDPFGVKVYRAMSPLSAPAHAAHLRISHPRSGQRLDATRIYDSGYHMPQRIEIRADLDHPVFGDVTFRIRTGQTPYQFLGVDRSPPYRIFLDPFPYLGKTVSIEATFADTFGGTHTARVDRLTFQAR